MGQKGLKEISKTNHLNTAYFVKEASKLSNINIKYKKDFYNEVVLEIKNNKVEDFITKLEEKNIIAGVPLKYFYSDFENSILINFTEIHKKKDIDKLINAIGETE
jgi:glycine cleavage system pyridoxal-binding protein P